VAALRRKDFNRIIEIKEREAYRVKLFMGMIDQREKTIVFCATQDACAGGARPDQPESRPAPKPRCTACA
jgi:hypothetical protein